MSSNADSLLSKLTVRLKEVESNRTIGTGLILYQPNFKEKVYIITAAHCLFEDGTGFNQMFPFIKIDIYNPNKNSYDSLTVEAGERLIIKDADKDIGICVIEKSLIEGILGEIPVVHTIKHPQGCNDFMVKGFPNATEGKELAVINPTWLQNMVEVSKFQLQLNEDYVETATKGFSGSGAFSKINQEIYLLGIFTRFREEERGKVIYCQYIHTANEILRANFLPLITFSFLGQNGLNPDYFKQHIAKSIKNLGPRFSEELNLKLPISRLFNDIAKDEYFRTRFTKAFDKWLTQNNYKRNQENNHLKDIENALFELVNDVKDWIRQLDFSVEHQIDIEWVEQKISDIDELVRIKQGELYDLRKKKMIEEKDDKKDHSYRRPLEHEINRLHEIISHNNELTNDIYAVNIHLSNNPVLIIKGEAGSGKSHLLGDIAFERQKLNLPSFLLLGQHFKNSRNVEGNILELLGLNCSYEELLKSANSIGEQIGSRFLILIDALNEGAGAALWKDEIEGFVHRISQYPYIALVMSVRTTYFNSLLPKTLRENNRQITIKNHEGLKGNEYKALHLFCKHYGLQQPNFPILSPEFTNPLFLMLICEGVKNSPDKSFPQGFQGISKVFKYYVDSLHERLVKKRETYAIRPDLIREAINKFSQQCFDNDDWVLKLNEAVTLFDKEFPKFEYLLNDLIQESVFIRNIRNNYKTDKDEEIVYFAYERFGDFFTVGKLLDKYKSKKELKKVFEEDGELGGLVKNGVYYRKNRGLLEALSVLLPERFGLELFEAYSWLFKKDSREKFGNADSWISQYVLEGLKWRSIESVDAEKLRKWLNGKYSDISYDDYLVTITELTTVKEHPLNSDHLHRILNYYTMPERDSRWQRHTNWYGGYDDDDNAFPLRRLIDWAWVSGISFEIDTETARLTGQTLAWILSSTNRRSRDQTTKAIVNLLEQQPKALIAILKAFEDIDDKYISERLYAVAYGCVLRTAKSESIKEIAQYIYDTIFKEGNPPEHILLRDYARNAVEYAICKQVGLNIDEELIRPPYKSQMPIFPTEDDISRYNIDHESSLYDKQHWRLFTQIHFSVMRWDFGNKIVAPKLRNFYPVNFNLEKQYIDYISLLSKKKKEFVKMLLQEDKLRLLLINRKNRLTDILGTEKYESQILSCESFIEKRINHIENIFGDESQFVKQDVIPFLRNKQEFESKRSNYKFDSIPARRWIVKRVFELGYNIKLHGDYDKDYSRYSRDNNLETIGKKYQWIAFHEIMSILTDNYKIKNGWSSDSKYEYYKGTWRPYLRDIDPVYTKYKGYEGEEDLDAAPKIRAWWSDDEYQYWNQPNSEWFTSIDDIPDVNNLLQKNDDEGQTWVFLYKSKHIEEPKQVGDDKYNRDSKRMWPRVISYIVRKKDRDKIIGFLKNKDLTKWEMPGINDYMDGVFNREKFWSPAYLDYEQTPIWNSIRYNSKGTNLKIMSSVESAKSGISDDKSGANSFYDIPCRFLFEGLNLQYSPIDGDIEDSNGNLVATNTSPDGIMIKKDVLSEYLKNENLDIIWCFLSDKICGHFPEVTSRSTFSGVYYMENDLLKGKINRFDW